MARESLSEPSTPVGAENSGSIRKSVSSSLHKNRKSKEADRKCLTVIEAARLQVLKAKRDDIAKFLEDKTEEDLHSHVDSLRRFALSDGGLVDDEFRAIIWPVLAEHLSSSEDCSRSPSPSHDEESTSDSDFESAASQCSAHDAESDEPPSAIFDNTLEMLQTHKEWRQVELDVHRTLARFPPNISEDQRVNLQDELTPLIVSVLSSNPNFNYYQGFHDVCLTLLLVLDVEDALKVAKNLAANGAFSAYLLHSLEDTVCKDLELMYIILSRVEPSLEKILRTAQVGTLFAVSWPLTWFSHSIDDYRQIVRVFDAFLASHPLLPIYLSAAVVLYRKEEVYRADKEMPILHSLLGRLPRDLPIDALLSDALYLMLLMPPSLLRGRFLDEYRAKTANQPLRAPAQLSRYAIQLVFLGSVGVASYLLYNFPF